MFNGDMKNHAIQQLEVAHKSYKKALSDVSKASEDLYTLRKESSDEVIGAVEKYVNTLANTPKEFDRTFSKFRAEYRTFNEIIWKLQKEAESINTKAGVSVAAGVAIGAGVAAFAPTAAMAVATTFGVASTGTAISVLSGAAATNAAIAWLGGGALAAGGGGMVSGSALLALAGPVGWAIGGTALAGGALFVYHKNKNIVERADRESSEFRVKTKNFETAHTEIMHLHSLTTEHVEGVKKILARLKSEAPHDYINFSQVEKSIFGALINHVHSLSALLNKKVDA